MRSLLSEAERQARERAYQREYRRKRRASDPEFKERELAWMREKYAKDSEFRERINQRIRRARAARRKQG